MYHVRRMGAEKCRPVYHAASRYDEKTRLAYQHSDSTAEKSWPLYRTCL